VVSKLYQHGGVPVGRLTAVALPLFLLLVISTGYALQVTTNPEELSGTVSKSTPYTSFTAAITLEANETRVVVLMSNNTVGIAGPTEITASGTYNYRLYFPPSAGSYSGTITFRAYKTDGTYFDVQKNFSYSVTSWESQYEDYFERGTTYRVSVGTEKYRMKIKDIEDSTVLLYFDGETYYINEGEDEVLSDNVKVKVSNVFTHGAVLEIYTKGDPVDVTIYKPEAQTGDTSGFTFTVRKYSKYVQAGMKYTVQFTLVNNTDHRVELRDVYFENTTVTPEGEKPTRLEDYSLPSYLDPGQEVTFNVVIDTVGLSPGTTYTPTLVVTGKVGDTDVRAMVDFTINVVSGVISGKTQTQAGGETAHPQVPARPPVQTLKRLTIDVVPATPNPGDTVTVYAKDAETGQYVNATITINGQQRTTFTADWCKTYNIVATAEGYVTATRTVRVKCRTMNVVFSPASPKEGDTVTFAVTDAETGEPITGYTIKINGMPVIPPWTAKPGRHMVVVSAEGYSPRTLTIVVEEQPPELVGTLPSEVNVGEKVILTLTKPANWEVYDANGFIIESGQGDTISFTPEEPGTYTIKVNGKDFATITAVEPLQQNPGLGIGGDWAGWLVLLAVIAFIAYNIVKGGAPVGKKEKSSPVAFELRPKRRKKSAEEGEET